MSEKTKAIIMFALAAVLILVAFLLWRASGEEPVPEQTTPVSAGPTLGPAEPTEPVSEDPTEAPTPEDDRPDPVESEETTQDFDEEEALTGAVATLTDSVDVENASYAAVSAWLTQPYQETNAEREARLKPLFAPESSVPGSVRPVPDFGSTEMDSRVTGLSWTKLYDAGSELVGVMVDVQLETVRMIDGVRQIDRSPVVAYVTLMDVGGTWLPLDITT